ncbi:phage tail length tape measure family protein [Phreatobacter sp. AB_2022a]|uniref:phage tail length tape measure family protein n=1 Tax=Phreatobacter sp. AB_2022a TaxID=3003134 RepID=UPI002286E7AC|nr:phage tail length tape measure family protein [Phreatobacter sp. AB_2022a]MCZ0734575.1 phage tail length tape measure family protein [Phreatobacter sp. AB_2022a]
MAEQVVTELIVDTGRAAVQLDQYVRDMGRASQAADVATKKSDDLSAAVRRVQNVSLNSVTIDRAAKQIDAIHARVDPAFMANKRIELAASRIDRAVSLGITSREQGDDLLARYRETVERTIAPTTRLAGANDNFAKSTGASAYAVRNLGFQVNDIATMLASGSSPFQVLATQGGQVFQIWQDQPSVFRDFASSVGSVLTPARLATGGLLAMAAAAAYAYSAWADGQKELQRSLVGLGKDSGATLGQLNAITAATASLRGGSIAENRGTVGALAGTGRIGPQMIGSIAGIRRDFAATLGLDAVEANKMLAASFADPARGAETLNTAVGGLNQRTQDYVRYLSQSGHEQRAQQVLLDAIAPRLGRAEELTNFWARAWDRVKVAASGAVTASGEAIDRYLTSRGSVESLVDQRIRSLQAEAAGDAVVDRTTGRFLGSRSTFGETQEALSRRLGVERQINAELQIQLTTQNALVVGAQALTSSTEQQAAAAALAARNNRVHDAAVDGARRQGQPGQRLIDDIRPMISELETTRRDAERLMREMPGSQEYFDALARNATTARALQGRLRDDGRAVFDLNARGAARFRPDLYGPQDEYGNRALRPESFATILAQRLSPIDNANEAARVDTLLRQARTAGERGSAAAAQVYLNSRQQGGAAGTQAEVDNAARIARDRELQQSQFQLGEAFRQRRNAQLDAAETLRREIDTMGGSIAVQERVRVEQQLMTDARRQYRRELGDSAQIPFAEAEAYRQLAKAMGEARQEQALVRLRQDLTFESQTMFLPDSERRVAQTMRNVYGEGWSSQMDSAVAAQVRFNEQLRLTGDLFSGFGSGMLQDLRSGATLWGALGNQVARVGDRLLSMAMDNAIKQLLGGLLGGSGGMGWLGGLFGVGGAAGGGFAGTPGGSFSYGAGGYTGTGPFMANGGIFGPAGLHPFALGAAFTNSIVDRPTLFPFANGTGLMGEAGPEAIMPLQRDSRGRLGVSYTPSSRGQGQGGFTGNVIVNNNGQAMSASVRSDSQGNMVIDLETMADRIEARQARNISRRNSPIGNAMAGAYGLQQRPVVG